MKGNLMKESRKRIAFKLSNFGILTKSTLLFCFVFISTSNAKIYLNGMYTDKFGDIKFENRPSYLHVEHEENYSNFVFDRIAQKIYVNIQDYLSKSSIGTLVPLKIVDDKNNEIELTVKISDRVRKNYNPWIDIHTEFEIDQVNYCTVVDFFRKANTVMAQVLNEHTGLGATTWYISCKGFTKQYKDFDFEQCTDAVSTEVK